MRRPGTLLLVGRLLNGGGRRVRSHLPCRDRDGNVVDHAPDRRPEVLIEIVLMVGRLGEIVSQALEQGIGERGSPRP